MRLSLQTLNRFQRPRQKRNTHICAQRHFAKYYSSIVISESLPRFAIEIYVFATVFNIRYLCECVVQLNLPS